MSTSLRPHASRRLRLGVAAATVVVVAIGVMGVQPADGVRPDDTATSAARAHARAQVPSVVGRPAAGAQLTCRPAVANRKVANLRFSWRRDGKVLPLQRQARLRVTKASVGHEISCATRLPGTRKLAHSAEVEIVVAPRNTDAPDLTGGLPGQSLSCTTGTWDGDPTYTYSWTRNGSPTGGKTPTLPTGTGDLGATYVCLVTGTNPAGSSGAVASNPITITATGGPAPTSAPRNTDAPDLTGGLPGQPLSCTTGTWDGDPTYTYTWTRNGSPTGGNTPTLPTGTGDLGATYVCLVTGTNPAGSSGAVASNQVTLTADGAPAPTSAPTNTHAPELTGILNPGQTLTCDPGAWSDDSDLSYAWTRNGSPTGNTTTTYAVGMWQSGHQIACLVRGANSIGTSGYVSSPVVTIVTPPAPTPTAGPTLTGDPAADEELVCSTGTFSHHPLSYTVTFTVDGVAAAAHALTTPGTATYTTTTADVGHTVGCTVTAFNAGGEGSATTGTLVPVPTNQTIPAITGVLEVGRTLTCSPGTWDIADTYTYEWTRAGTTGTIGSSSSYDTVPADADGALRCAVTATRLAATSTPATSEPVTVTDPAPAALPEVFAGADSFSAYAVKNGAVAAWGSAPLGDGTESSRTVPVAVTTTGALAGKTVTDVAVGIGHSLALSSDGKVYAWGYNGNGQLGDGTTATRPSPIAVTGGALAGKSVTAIATGSSHSLALADDGTVYAWGFNYYGLLGDGTTTHRYSPVAVTGGALAGKTIVAIEAGDYHSLALADDGSVYAWGVNWNGQLGDGSTADRTTPVAVATSGALAGRTIASISAGNSHSLALDSAGKVYAWGGNGNGQLGDGTHADRSTPVAVTTSGTLAGKTVTAIATGREHSLAVSSDDKVYAWGHNGYGALGDGTTTNRSTPVAVDMSGALAGKTVTSIAGGLYFTVAATSDGGIYSWGWDLLGSLGGGTGIDRHSPGPVSLTGPLAP